MKFKFRLESVLRYRKSLETVAQKDYAIAQLAVRKQMDLIQSMYDLIDKTRTEISSFEKIGNISEISMRNSFISGQKVKIETERFKARELLQNEELAHEKLVEASREKKVLEVLKDKKIAEYKKERNKKERKINDNLVSMRFKRGQAS